MYFTFFIDFNHLFEHFQSKGNTILVFLDKYHYCFIQRIPLRKQFFPPCFNQKKDFPVFSCIQAYFPFREGILDCHKSNNN